MTRDEHDSAARSLAVAIQRLRPDAILPSYAHDGDAGLDLHAVDAVRVEPRERVAVATGLAMAIPNGWAGFVHPRSGLALRQGITVANAPGTIDAGYRGEVRVLIVNLGTEPYDIAVGDRIAQLVVQPVARVEVVDVTTLDPTARGDGGFGSTGRD